MLYRLFRCTWYVLSRNKKKYNADIGYFNHISYFIHPVDVRGQTTIKHGDKQHTRPVVPTKWGQSKSASTPLTFGSFKIIQTWKIINDINYTKQKRKYTNSHLYPIGEDLSSENFLQIFCSHFGPIAFLVIFRCLCLRTSSLFARRIVDKYRHSLFPFLAAIYFPNWTSYQNNLKTLEKTNRHLTTFVRDAKMLSFNAEHIANGCRSIYLSHDTTKRVFGSFRPGQTQTGLHSHRC